MCRRLHSEAKALLQIALYIVRNFKIYIFRNESTLVQVEEYYFYFSWRKEQPAPLGKVRL